jgi:hypothetical protein
MKVYKINWDYMHLVKNKYDLLVIDKFEQISNHASIKSILNEEIPKEINFKSNVVDVSHLNFPVNDLALPILSKKVFDIFFEIIKPRKIVKINIFHQKEQIDNREFCTFQLDEYFDCFDYENSVYESNFILPISNISKFILKPSDFPDIFRINLCIPHLFVNEKVKNKLEALEVKDIVFEEMQIS